MHGMKKKRVPRTLTNPVVEALRSAQPIAGKDLSDLRRAELASLDRLAQGVAAVSDWARISDVINIAEVMAKVGEGVELIAIAAEAQVTLAKAYIRGKDSGVWALTPDEAWMLREAWEYHDLQRQSVPMSRYRQHAKKVQDIHRTGKTQSPRDLVEQVNGL